MRYPAAIPAITLGAGITAGIFFSVPVHQIVPLLLLLSAVAVFAVRRDRWTLALIACGFVSAGLVLGRKADFAARNAPLRGVFDRQVPPGELQLFTNVSGMLRSDASVAPSGVSLNVLVDRIDLN